MIADPFSRKQIRIYWDAGVLNVQPKSGIRVGCIVIHSLLVKIIILTVFYILKMTNDTERFLKIGITKNSISSRYGNKLPYDSDILVEHKMSLKAAYEREQQRLTQYSKYKYLPKIKLGGHTECFNFSVSGELTNGC